MKYFKFSEFTCKCGCGRAEMMPSALEKLEDAREKAGIPFKITSGYRCDAHNASVGGKSEGAHTSGYAIDIEASVSPSRLLIVKALLDAGFTRIGVAKTFIHADDDPSKPQKVMWVY
jgi:hypothetical protein